MKIKVLFQKKNELYKLIYIGVTKKLVFNIKYSMVCLITSISELMSPELV